MGQQALEGGAKLVAKAISLENCSQHRLAAFAYLDAVRSYTTAINDGSFSQQEVAFMVRNIGQYTDRAQKLLESEELQEIESTDSLVENGAKHQDHGQGRHSQDIETTELDTSSIPCVPNSYSVPQEKVAWSDIIGLEDAKLPMQEAVYIPILFPNSPQAAAAHKGLLLFGPGGVGKTQLCKAVASHAGGATLMVLRTDMLLSKWMGESEKLLRKTFQEARQRRPTIMLIDEVDSLCGSRDEDCESSRRFKNTLLCEMDGMDDMNGVFIIGATNQPYSLDASFLRRFPRRVYVALPKRKDREELIRLYTKPYANNLDASDLHHISVKTYGFSGSDIKTLVTEAGLEPLRDYMAKNKDQIGEMIPDASFRPVTLEDFNKALKKCFPANSAASIRKLEEWNEKHGCNANKVDEYAAAKSPGFWRTFFEVFGVPI